MGSSISNPGAGEPERPEVVNNPKPDEAELQKQARQENPGWLVVDCINSCVMCTKNHMFSMFFLMQ